MLTKHKILDALRGVEDPVSGKDIVALNFVRGLVVSNDHIGFALEVPPARGAGAEPLRRAAEETIKTLAPTAKVTVVLTAHLDAPVLSAKKPAAQKSPAPQPVAIPHVRHVIAVASGKGGVGKSTTAVNLALALAQLGVRTGLLDADVYGPSVPRMLDLQQAPKLNDDKLLLPLEKYGLKILSIGFMVEESSAMIWRGPMVISALRQLLHGAVWGTAEHPLDVLVVDMPPGTGDAHLTLAQKVPVAGAVIVSTPQDIALIDARRGITMFRRVGIPVLGIVENMSVYVCPHCGHEDHIFGTHGARDEAQTQGVDFLGEIPLHLDIRTASDAGEPLMIAQPAHAATTAYRNIAAKIKSALEKRPDAVVAGTAQN